MAIVTFCSNSTKETGNTYSAIATASYMSIEHNMKVLLVSTNLNEDTVRTSFWSEKTKNTQGKSANVQSSGIEGLSRMVSSSKIEPRIIKDYTEVVLGQGRFDVLLGCNGSREQYKEIQTIYPQVISVANQTYNIVIVDLDKKLEPNTKSEIVKMSDVIVLTTDQKTSNIQRLVGTINENNIFDPKNTLISIGKYDDTLKSNARNVTRSILKQKKMVNTVPYNGRFFEASQDGEVIDLFLKLLTLTNKKDPNYLFVQEVGNLVNDINAKIEETRIRKSMR